MDPYREIYTIVRKIPKGRVATYGQIAQLASAAGPHRVGYALKILQDKTVPWHRVINAAGEISQRWRADSMNLQHDLLAKEGIAFDKNHRVDLSIFKWQPKNSHVQR